jgi:xanthine dehydrogenase large subunit
MFGIETVIEEIAQQIGKDPLDVRKINLYREPAVSGDAGSMTTQYGQVIEDFIADKVIDQVEAESAYRARRESISSYNKNSKHKKRGVALVPLKFGISAAQHLHGRLGQRQSRWY